MRQILPLVCGLIISVISSNLSAQELSEKIITKSGLVIELKIRDEKEGKSINGFVFESPSRSVDTVSEKRLLVKFKSQPLARSSAANSSARSRSLEQDHAKFLSDLQQFQRTTSTRGSKPQLVSVLAEYKQVFNGYSIIASSDIEAKIRQLSYVASVMEDKKVQIVDQASNEVIRADKVWSDFDITGRGVVIGIIDTGIDYTHPDLGGAIGPSHKVIGGYDFVNEDTDPIDDHGHGTHVAGIASANGAIKGVAPDAKLMAFKALTDGGWGYDSWILAAIERTVDPDQNPNTNDALDVVNMSIGRPATIDDPYSEAIANATAMGVTFVVAAGNEMNNFSVTAPGVAPDAITVGATYMWDATTYFSSKGPTEFEYTIKPDVAAPGYEINSTFLQNSYLRMNGTSMASPHVAGAVALLLEKNPSWTPDIIKGALMNNAKRSSESYWSQGAGRIDVFKSVEPKFVVSPGSLSLGMYNRMEAAEKTFNTMIHNTSNQTKEFSISVTGEILNDHVTAQVQPASVTIAPGQSKEVTIVFNTVVGLPYKIVTEGYFGEVVVSSNDETVRVPVAMVNLQKTKLIFSEPLPLRVDVIGLNELFFQKIIYPTTSEYEVSLPAGKFEMTALYNYNYNTLVIQEAVDPLTSGDVLLTQNLAKNKVSFAFKDVNGEPIQIDPNIHVGGALFSCQKFWGIYGFAVDTFYVSDNSVVSFDVMARDTFSNGYYELVAGASAGQTQNREIIKKADRKFTIELGDEVPRQMQYITTSEVAGKGGVTIYNYYPQPVSDKIEIYATSRSPSDNFGFSKALIMGPGEHDEVETGFFGCYEDNLVKFSELIGTYPRITTALYKSENFTYELGASLLRWNGRIINEGERINLFDFPSIGLFNYTLNERNQGQIQYELTLGEQIIKSGTISNRTYHDPVLFYQPILDPEVVPDAYSLSLKFDDHRIHATQGSAQVDLSFDLRKEDKDSPFVSYFSLERDGVTTNNIKSGEHGVFRMAVSDCSKFLNDCTPATSGVASAKLFIKKEGHEWQELELIKLGEDTLVTNLPETLQQGYYSTKVVAADAAGNDLTYTLSPAFFIAPSEVRPLPKLALLAPSNHSRDIPYLPVFKWSDTEVVSYTFQLSRFSTFATLESDITLTENEFDFPSSLNFNKTYFWRVRPNYENQIGEWSDVFDFRTKDFKVNLLEPANQSLQSNFDFVTFTWEGTSGVAFYDFQLSKDSAFNVLETNGWTSNLSYQYLDYPQVNVKYYWRVRPFYASGHFGGWSEVFSFTGDQPLILMKPVNQSVLSGSDFDFEWGGLNNVTSYNFQLSKDPEFSSIEDESEVTELLYHYSHSLESNSTYYWRVRPYYNLAYYGDWSSPFSFTTSIITGLVEQPGYERKPVAYPNPFTEGTTIEFYTTKAGEISIQILNPQGQEIDTFKKYIPVAGKQSIDWKKDITPGVYLCKIASADKTEVVKLIRQK